MNNNTILLKCNNVAKRIGNFCLSDIDFELETGYILGIIGRNGSGKTTLLRLILGIYELEEKGEIELEGVCLKKDIVAYKRQIAYVLKESPFPMTFNALDVAKLYGHYYESFDIKKYDSFLKEFEVPQKVALNRLSKGQQIRQQLAFALSYKAKLYVLDEPVANLDIEFREIFHKYVREMSNNGAVLYVSHLIDELEQLVDYVLWLNTSVSDEGVKVSTQRYFGTVDDLKEEYQILEVSRQEARDISNEYIVGISERENHQELLVNISRDNLPENLIESSRYASLKELMYYTEKGVSDI